MQEKNKKNVTEDILTCQIGKFKHQDTIQFIRDWLDEKLRNKVPIFANPHSLVVANTDPIFQKSMRTADLVTPDGIGILLVSRILGGSIRNCEAKCAMGWDHRPETGGVFDFYADTKVRSSLFWQRLCLEWLMRFLQEPRRLWERNMKSTSIFLKLDCPGKDSPYIFC